MQIDVKTFQQKNGLMARCVGEWPRVRLSVTVEGRWSTKFVNWHGVNRVFTTRPWTMSRPPLANKKELQAMGKRESVRGRCR